MLIDSDLNNGVHKNTSYYSYILQFKNKKASQPLTPTQTPHSKATLERITKLLSQLGWR